VTNHGLLDREKERDDIVRTVVCPCCGAGPVSACDFGTTEGGKKMWSHSSHTGRYNAAAESGLVPRLPGQRDG
jgi:hypothetical protein